MSRPAEIAPDAAPRVVATVALPVYADALETALGEVRASWAERHGTAPYRILIDVNFIQGKKLLIIDARQL